MCNLTRQQQKKNLLFRDDVLNFTKRFQINLSLIAVRNENRSNHGIQEQFDNVLLSIAQQHTQRGAGVEGLLDTFFGFLQRKTDFFYGAEEGKAEEIIMRAAQKQVDRAKSVRKQRMEARRKAQEKQDAQMKREEERRKRAEEAGKKRAEARKKAQSATTSESGPEISIIEEEEEEEKEDVKDLSKKSAEAVEDGAAAEDKNGEADADSDEDGDDDDDEPAPIGNGGSTDTYRWTQTLQEVNLFVAVPAGIRASTAWLTTLRRS